MIAMYLLEMLKVCALAAPVYLVCRFLWVRFVRRCRTVNWYHETGLLLFVCYLVSICSITMNPVSIAIAVANNHFGPSFDSVNLIPFRQIAEYGGLSSGFEVVNLLGNILMFSPVGFFAVWLWRQRHPLAAGTLWTMAFSVLIEFVQLFSMRGTDIDDVILNTAGGFIGALVGVLLAKLIPRLSAKFIIQKE